FLCGEEAAPPDVFMLWGHYNEVFEGISRRLTALGARSINDIDAKRVVCSKLSTALVLEQAGIPQAKTMLVTSATPAELVVKTIGLPAVLKPSDGAQGAGVVLLHTEEEIAQYLSELPECDGRAVLAQEYIAAAKGKDIRVTMIDYQVGNVIQRVADNPDEFRSNVHLGGHVQDYELDEDTIRLCERIARVVGLRLCGIDLLETGDGYVVGEVNCTPGMAPSFLNSERFRQLMHALITG
ncbi:MAG: RimK family alpha-L-glutamate ligase, partial [Ruminococcus sp.]|nr:RimK family alpha-L-glutamate ligase [Ruminococcus sp.]